LHLTPELGKSRQHPRVYLSLIVRLEIHDFDGYFLFGNIIAVSLCFKIRGSSIKCGVAIATALRATRGEAEGLATCLREYCGKQAFEPGRPSGREFEKGGSQVRKVLFRRGWHGTS
jgi:hypothetical protein